MTTKTQKGSVTVDAYQWTTSSTLTALRAACPWAWYLAFHTPGDGSLHVPTSYGVTKANPTDWIHRTSDGTVDVINNAAFTLLYS
jgi:hypothetical protein